MRRLRAIGALALLTAVCALPQAAIDSRIDTLLARMTLDEKIGQMSQSTSMGTLTGAIKVEIRAGRWGSFLNAGSPADRAEAQRIATTESRLHIPLLFGRDVIHGYKTILPIPLGQAATWDPEAVEDGARLAAREASKEGIHWTFAPMLDIARDPRWGRVAESLGEDPRLASVLAAAMVRGFQGKALTDAQSVAACAKHFVGYGAAEAGRDYNTVWIPDLLLREVYLPPFRAAVSAGVASFMTAFNTLNGVPASGNSFLLRQILRDEWHYDGLVVSDYESVAEMIKHGYAADASDAARKALEAGVDMEMVSTSYFDHLKTLVSRGAVKMPEIDGAVRNILRLKFRMGLFDKPIPAAAVATPDAASLQVAQRAAAESLVLLKNAGGVLPLADGQGPVAVIGPLADSPADQIGTWAMDGRPEDMRTPLAALRQALGANRVLYSPGLQNSRDLSRAGFAAAVEAARRASVVLLFLGEESILSGEARSRAFLDLPGAQQELVEAIHATGKPIVTVIMAGRPLTFHQTASQSAAVLYAWHPGAMGGPAIADVLWGRTAPSGRLPMTFPRTVGQIPIYYNHLNTGRPASESELGIPMGNPEKPAGYTSKYIDVDFTPEYPFGFGMTYSTIEYSAVKVSAPALRADESLTVDTEVTNRGTHAAVETVQFYIRELTARVAQPVRKLIAFQRVPLGPGERRTVSFTVTPKDLTFYNSQLQLVSEPGRFQVWIAPDSASGPSAFFNLE